MKKVFTVSLDEDTVLKIMDARRTGRYPNKSRLVEEAILEFLEVKK
jgi:Arc/MetJ-type ribon-helix-helix transcriptional regulator